mmetsp:Transcript_19128/g.57750  ORF Transcript_19128/g.57750 Transcript_19128/m.57750 type:complete len:93 (+) Transcript_19128:184-462(+)
MNMLTAKYEIGTAHRRVPQQIWKLLAKPNNQTWLLGNGLGGAHRTHVGCTTAATKVGDSESGRGLTNLLMQQHQQAARGWGCAPRRASSYAI